MAIAASRITSVIGFCAIIPKSQPYISTLVCIEDFEEMSTVGSGEGAASIGAVSMDVPADWI
jgi:hypothetical protein